MNLLWRVLIARSEEKNKLNTRKWSDSFENHCSDGDLIRLKIPIPTSPDLSAPRLGTSDRELDSKSLTVPWYPSNWPLKLEPPMGI
jgi:hypothetical protein